MTPLSRSHISAYKHFIISAYDAFFIIIIMPPRRKIPRAIDTIGYARWSTRLVNRRGFTRMPRGRLWYARRLEETIFRHWHRSLLIWYTLHGQRAGTLDDCSFQNGAAAWQKIIRYWCGASMPGHRLLPMGQNAFHQRALRADNKNALASVLIADSLFSAAKAPTIREKGGCQFRCRYRYGISLRNIPHMDIMGDIPLTAAAVAFPLPPFGIIFR